MGRKEDAYAHFDTEIRSREKQASKFIRKLAGSDECVDDLLTRRPQL